MFSDILSLYKNFGHWIVSKVCISISRYVVTFLFVLPLIVFLIIIVGISPYSFLEYQVIFQDILIAIYPLGGNFLGFTIWSMVIFIIIILLIIVSLISVFYNRILLAKLHITYIEKNRLEYKNNVYLDKNIFFKYFKISGIMFGIFLLMVIIFLIGAFILFFIFGGVSGVDELLINSGTSNIFSVGSFLYFLVCIITLLYIYYRIYFSFFILIDDDKKSIKQCIFESIQLTKGYKNIGKLIFFLILLFIVYLPLSYIQQIIDFNSKNISYYISMKNYVGNDKPNERLNGDEFYAFTKMESQYSQYTNQELVGKDNFMRIMNWIYAVFNFVFLYGVFDMLLASFYRRELLKK